MTDAVIADASAWARALVARESRGPGDLDNAMRRIGQRYGIPYSTLWALRYRRPRDILASIYFRLRAAYEAECERQLSLLRHELEITKAKAGTAHPVVAATVAVLDAADEPLDEGTSDDDARA